MSSAAPSRCAPGRFSIPSFSAARATLNASIESDLPRSRDERLAPAMCFGATRTICSPRARRNRSSAPETCRQSSIAHTRSESSFRAHRSSLPKLPLRAGTVSSPRAAAVSASTAPQVCVFLCVSVPITIIRAVPSIVFDEADPRRTNLTRGWCQAPIRSRRWSSGGDGRHDIRWVRPSVDRKSMSQPVASPGTNRSGRTSPPGPRKLLSKKVKGLGRRFRGSYRSSGRSPRG